MGSVLDEYGDLNIHLMKKSNKDFTIALTLCGRITPIKVIASYEEPVTCDHCMKIDDAEMDNTHIRMN